jgi:two-component system chemotaxis response regulator CheY
MPEMNGPAVVEAVRAKKEWNKTRIIMATTEGSKSSVLEMIKKGANGYMVKPFQEDAIFKTLNTITARMQR